MNNVTGHILMEKDILMPLYMAEWTSPRSGITYSCIICSVLEEEILALD